MRPTSPEPTKAQRTGQTWTAPTQPWRPLKQRQTATVRGGRRTDTFDVGGREGMMTETKMTRARWMLRASRRGSGLGAIRMLDRRRGPIGRDAWRLEVRRLHKFWLKVVPSKNEGCSSQLFQSTMLLTITLSPPVLSWPNSDETLPERAVRESTSDEYEWRKVCPPHGSSQSAQHE